MKLAGIITGFLFLSASLQLSAQQLIFKTYTVEDGLVANPVRNILQDSRGFIWIATWEGLSKYDGHKFTNYTTVNVLSHNLVNDMYESPDGKIFVAENNGSVDILQQDALVKKASFSNVPINHFYVMKDHRVIATTDTSGLYEIKNGSLVKPPQEFPGLTYGVFAELNDSLLIVGSEGSLGILNNQFKLISEIKQTKDILTNKIYKDSKNKVWVGTNKGLKLVSVYQRDDHSLSFALLPAPFNIPVLRNNIITDMLEDDNGNFWITTTHGLVKIDTEGGWKLFSEKDGLPSSDTKCIYQDTEKNIWIGTFLGLSKLVTKNEIRIYTIENTLGSNNFFFLHLLKHDQFFTGTGSDVQLFNSTNKQFSSITPQHILLYGGMVQNSQPPLFFGNNNRFGKYDPVNQRIEDHILPGPPNPEVYCSVMDANGIIFSGTQKGLIIRSGEKFWYENRLPYRITFLLLDKKGYLWAGTWNNGMFRIHYTGADEKVSLSVEDFSELLPDKNIRSLFEDSKGNIWVGTRYQGIVQLKNGNEQSAAKYFDLKQGLMSNWARTITEDEKGCMWIGSNLGIDKLIPAGNSFRVFNFSRVNNFFADIYEIFPENEHSLWLATGKGLVNFIDGELEKTPPLPIYITSVHLGDTSFNYNTYHADSKVQLKYFQNQAAFEFSAPGFINEKQVLYNYRLLGSADTAWSEPANLHNVSYASLQPGNYRFEVRTTGWNGVWGVPANFSFNIRKPYWQTWWFYSFVGLIVVLFFYALYRYRISQLLKLQKVRNRIASDLHDDIGATLTNINMLSEISRKNLEHPLEAEKFLRRISEEVTSTSQALNDIIWSVNSRNDSMEETLTRMRRYAADLFDNSNTVCHLSIDEAAAGKKLSMEQRRDLYLIYKESMNNILKYASANNVWINVQWRSGKLHLKIKDDGKGFEPAVITNSNGLKNIRSRTEKWKGSIIINSAPGQGTSIEIMIPLTG